MCEKQKRLRWLWTGFWYITSIYRRKSQPTSWLGCRCETFRQGFNWQGWSPYEWVDTLIKGTYRILPVNLLPSGNRNHQSAIRKLSGDPDGSSAPIPDFTLPNCKKSTSVYKPPSLWCLITAAAWSDETKGKAQVGTGISRVSAFGGHWDPGSPKATLVDGLLWIQPFQIALLKMEHIQLFKIQFSNLFPHSQMSCCRHHQEPLRSLRRQCSWLWAAREQSGKWVCLPGSAEVWAPRFSFFKFFNLREQWPLKMPLGIRTKVFIWESYTQTLATLTAIFPRLISGREHCMIILAAPS